MTNRLILMRHAKSDWTDSSMADFDRPLNPRGRRAAPQIARWLSEHKLIPERILCSSAVRARQTCELVLRTWIDELDHPKEGSEVIFIADLYLAAANFILQNAKEHSNGCSSLMLIGHNPGFELLASFLGQTEIHMPTASIAIFETEAWPDDWTNVADWRRKEVVFPREIGE